MTEEQVDVKNGAGEEDDEVESGEMSDDGIDYDLTSQTQSKLHPYLTAQLILTAIKNLKND